MKDRNNEQYLKSRSLAMCARRLVSALVISAFLLTAFAGLPTFASEVRIFRGDIKLPSQNISNLALKYPIVMIGGNYYMPLTRDFMAAIGLRLRTSQSYGLCSEAGFFEGEPADSLFIKGSPEKPWAKITAFSLDEMASVPLPESAFGPCINLDNIIPLTGMAYVGEKMLKCNLPFYSIDGVPYICIDYTNDIKVDSTAVLRRGLGHDEPVNLPGRYSTFDRFDKSRFVEDQGSTQNCWAHAAVSLFEIKVAVSEGVYVDFSIDHLISECPIPSTSMSGGNWRGSAAYFTRGIGPVTREAYQKFLNGDDEDGEDSSANSIRELRPEYLITGYSAVSGVDDIKQAIYENGAVLTSIYYGPSRSRFYNSEKFAYFHNDKSHRPTHELILVGWDDYFSASNFKERPEGDGAFIAMNSFGENYGDGGLFYISYYDDIALKNVVTIDSYVKPEHLIAMSRDKSGVTHYETIPGTGDLYAIVKLSADQLKSEFADGSSVSGKRIRGIGVFAGGEAIVTAYYSQQFPTRESKLVYLGETYFEGEGYKVIESYYNVVVKDEFYIVLKYDSSDRFVIPIEAPYPGIDYSIVAAPQTSFIAYKDRNMLKAQALEDFKPNGSIVLRLIVE